MQTRLRLRVATLLGFARLFLDREKNASLKMHARHAWLSRMPAHFLSYGAHLRCYNTMLAGTVWQHGLSQQTALYLAVCWALDLGSCREINDDDFR
ncbi:hypothetical protein [Hyphomicrobium sp.]|uniref:hypothetical protein n=1 Tax=Hyphomicrobium sp. TaxID=82 RepID=UPI002E348696|nr:hypothetical protein [Hyphomicrobium sp.]HEX2842308.1 hypothetical protein [Hyphomicrobium sp.]